MFFKLSDGNLTKIGPVAVSAAGTAPNSAPAGSAGNAVGEEWFDSRAALAAPVLKIYDGAQWLPSSGFTVDDASGDFSLTRELTVRSLVGNGTGEHSYIRLPEGPQSDEGLINAASGMMRFDTSENIFKGYDGTAWVAIGDNTGQDLTVQNLTVLGNTLLGNDCGTDILNVTAVTTFNCDTTIGANNTTSLTVGSASDFQSGASMTTQSDLRFHQGDLASNYVGFQAPPSIASSLTWTLPDADGAAGLALVTDGAGLLGWAEAGGGATVTVSDGAPTTDLEQGDLWYNSIAGRLYVYYDETAFTPPIGTDKQWVDVSPVSAGVANIVILDDLAPSFDGTTNAFQMTFNGGSPAVAANPQQLLIDLGGVLQRPNIDYTIVGAQITFTSPPQAGLTFNGRQLGAAISIPTGGGGSGPWGPNDLLNCATTTNNGKWCWLSDMTPSSDGVYSVGSASAKPLNVHSESFTVYGGDIMPATDNTANIGSPTQRFANIYTGDLHLANDRGDWTVIEEEEYLSLHNNKTGKTFKIVMEEV